LENQQEFQLFVKRIHQANNAWHSFEILNRVFLDLDESQKKLKQRMQKFQGIYLERKNELQKELFEKHNDKINFEQAKDENDTQNDNRKKIYSIKIKDQFQFQEKIKTKDDTIETIKYSDACHTPINHGGI
jgi:hypothetical protein